MKEAEESAEDAEEAHEAAVKEAREQGRAEALSALAVSVEKERADASSDSDRWPAANAFVGAFDWVLQTIEGAKAGGS